MGEEAAKGAPRGKWPLVRGKICFWDPKKVATGRVRGVAVGEG